MVVVKETADTKVGAGITPSGDTLLVGNVPANTLAKDAGLMKGDYIYKVSGEEGYVSQLLDRMGEAEGDLPLTLMRGNGSE